MNTTKKNWGRSSKEMLRLLEGQQARLNTAADAKAARS
jgi:hypothetical protein